MTEFPHVSATEFARNFARYKDEALDGATITVTRHGRVIGGYISAHELAHFERLKRRERQVLVVGELNGEVVGLIEAAE